MKKKILLFFVLPLLVSCHIKNNDSDNEALKAKLQGAWYTDSLIVNQQAIDTHKYPEYLSSFIFKDDKIRLIQMSDRSENSGTFKVSNDSIYVYDLILNKRVMTIKVNNITDKKLDLRVLDSQNVRMIMEKMEDVELSN